jgi:poly(3-hydroxybutyrate) depolymerase
MNGRGWLGIAFCSLVLGISGEALGAAPPPPINCNGPGITCGALDQPTIAGRHMFNETNFDAVIDGFGQTRKFWVHLPQSYDAVDGVTQKIPVIFAFHGAGQQREAMVAGKWDEYFDQDIAFVVPAAEADPCDQAGEVRWMQPTVRQPASTPGNAGCDPATQVMTVAGAPRTYWNASLPGTFNDVVFVEQLRAMVLATFPKLNPNKTYATGFSSGGGLTLSLLCYRSNLFRGYSVVAKMLAGDAPRGDYNEDGVVDTDPASLVATCGKNIYDTGHATGIAQPRLWGYGQILAPPFSVSLRITKPVALFAGDQDNPLADINTTGAMIRDKNNLNGTFWLLDPYLDVALDDATTQRRTFVTPLNATQPSAAFRRFMVRGIANWSGTHAMPDAQECATPPGPGNPPPHFGDNFMTCDYSYTTETRAFFQDFADMNFSP